MKRKNPLPSWLGLNRELDRQKLLSLILSAINAILVIVITYLVLSPPLVITEDRGKKDYSIARRVNVEVTSRDLEDVASQFILARYQWDQFDRTSIVKGITPFITNKLTGKIKKELTKLAKQFPKDKLISQSVANIQSEVTMEKIKVSFDRILKVDGLPLVTPIEVEFLMMEGNSNQLNPLGIYINNIIQYEAI